MCVIAYYLFAFFCFVVLVTDRRNVRRCNGERYGISSNYSRIRGIHLLANTVGKVKNPCQPKAIVRIVYRR